MQRQYCHICGYKVQEKNEGIWWCGNCGQHIYANPKPCIELVLFDNQDRLLLTVRANDPGKSKLAPPGGFVDLHETAEAALAREMEEELGLSPNQYSVPRYVMSFIMDYQWGKDMYQNMVTVFAAHLKSDMKIHTNEEINKVVWMNLAEIDPQTLAFPEHEAVLSRLAGFIRDPGIT